MKKQVLTLLMASLLTGTAFAAPGTVTEKTQVLESTVYGAPQDGAVVDRINQLDETVYGNGFSGNTATLSKRVDSLYDSVEGSGTNIHCVKKWMHLNIHTKTALMMVLW